LKEQKQAFFTENCVVVLSEKVKKQSPDCSGEEEKHSISRKKHLFFFFQRPMLFGCSKRRTSVHGCFFFS